MTEALPKVRGAWLGLFGGRPPMAWRLQQRRPFSAAGVRLSPSPAELYEKYVSEGEIERDAHQLEIVKHLDSMQKKLAAYSPPQPVEKKASFVRPKPLHALF